MKEPSWRSAPLFMYMKELTDRNYNEMLEYEKAGGKLTEEDMIARRHYEKYYKNRRKKNTDGTTEEQI